MAANVPPGNDPQNASMRCVRCGRLTEVRETRTQDSGVVNRRRRECTECGHKFNTYEIDDALEKTLKKYLKPHVKSVAKAQVLNRRNERIIDRLKAGDKHSVVANEFGLSDSSVSTIARNAGVLSFKLKRAGK